MGVVVTVNTRLNAIASITSAETLLSGVWTKTTKKEISDLVAQEIIETRSIPGNAMESDRVDQDRRKNLCCSDNGISGDNRCDYTQGDAFRRGLDQDYF